MRIRDLTVEYTTSGYCVRPLEALDLDADDGELVVLLGPSGCGKTTLLSTLAGILRPTRGRVQVAGTEVTGLQGAALTSYRRHSVGVVFQGFNLVPSLSARDNVAMPLRAAGRGARPARALADELLGEVGLGDRRHHRPGQLSGGQQQRVAIARALALDPPVLLADEPTAHLDHVQVESVLRLIRALARPGRLVIVSTHDDRLVPLADRCVDLTPRAVDVPHAPSQRQLASEEVLFSFGDAPDYVYVVDTGAVELLRPRTDGTDEQLRIVMPGEYFGELGPLLHLPRSATARAKVPTSVTAMSLPEFRRRRPPTNR